jgi:glucokinase
MAKKQQQQQPQSQTQRYAMGVDLGGTKILAAVVDQNGNVIGKGKKSTHAEKGPEVVIERIGKAMDDALESAGLTKQAISGIGIGAPGIVDSARAFVIEITNIPGFRNIDIGGALKKWHNVNVALSNDVRVAAVGEHRMGAGKGLNNLIAVFVGTGIGGGVILNGKVYEGSRGSAGEIGHIVTMADGPFAVGGGVRGGVEAIASRSAIERELRAGLAAGRVSELTELMKEKDGALTSSVLAKAVAKNDALTIEVLDRAAHYLGLHGASLINAFDPQALIYGGGVIEGLGEWMLGRIRTTALQYAINRHRLDEVQIVEAQLGDAAGVVGAALLALD